MTFPAPTPLWPLSAPLLLLVLVPRLMTSAEPGHVWRITPALLAALCAAASISALRRIDLPRLSAATALAFGLGALVFARPVVALVLPAYTGVALSLWVPLAGAALWMLWEWHAVYRQRPRRLLVMRVFLGSLAATLLAWPLSAWLLMPAAWVMVPAVAISAGEVCWWGQR